MLALAEARPVDVCVLPRERSRLFGKAFVMSPKEAVSLAERFGDKLAVLSHHEFVVSRPFPFGWMVDIPPPDPADFPPWFRIPVPGEHGALPWSWHEGPLRRDQEEPQPPRPLAL